MTGAGGGTEIGGRQHEQCALFKEERQTRPNISVQSMYGHQDECAMYKVFYICNVILN